MLFIFQFQGPMIATSTIYNWTRTQNILTGCQGFQTWAESTGCFSLTLRELARSTSLDFPVPTCQCGDMTSRENSEGLWPSKCKLNYTTHHFTTCDHFDSSMSSASLLPVSGGWLCVLWMGSFGWTWRGGAICQVQQPLHQSLPNSRPDSKRCTMAKECSHWHGRWMANQGEGISQCIQECHEKELFFCFCFFLVQATSALSLSPCRFWILWWCQGSEGNRHKGIIRAHFPIPQISIGCRPWTWHCNFLVPHMSNKQLFLKLWFGEGSTRLFFNLIVIFDWSARK